MLGVNKDSFEDYPINVSIKNTIWLWIYVIIPVEFIA